MRVIAASVDDAVSSTQSRPERTLKTTSAGPAAASAWIAPSIAFGCAARGVGASRQGRLRDRAPQLAQFGLDDGGMRRMRATIGARAAAGAAVILSSHLLTLVEELCTKLLVIRGGQCVAYGTLPQIVEAHPALHGVSLEAVFLALTGDGASPVSSP